MVFAKKKKVRHFNCILFGQITLESYVFCLKKYKFIVKKKIYNCINIKLKQYIIKIRHLVTRPLTGNQVVYTKGNVSHTFDRVKFHNETYNRSYRGPHSLKLFKKMVARFKESMIYYSDNIIAVSEE